ncbi:hypothetical protein EVAR_29457_1 [Eumeta japonica]|uniref:Uncharacterized protein n=1 Tax=Eumeta variegata TaxID=151549 RepID=A0A4C1WSY6_EUMVA|nr:hypothetical protein EVAR_29457_1 [Eumeta japonica]
MLKTDKSTLSKQLTSQIDSENPDKVDIEIIDGFYYMYQIGATLPQTFGKLAESILIKLCAKKAKEVHIVFDRYLKPSIKDCERQNREGNATPLEVENIILGDSQDDSADNEEDSDVCSDEVDSSDDSESSLNPTMNKWQEIKSKNF